jgi:hypothetical protein
MNRADYDYGLTQALKGGLISALTSVVLLGTAIALTPPEWTLAVTHLVATFVIVFFTVAAARSAGSDVLVEFGLNYPDLTSERSLHNELTEMRRTLNELSRQLHSKS